MKVTVSKKTFFTAAAVAGLALLYLAGILAIQAAPTAPTRAMLAAYAFPIDCMIVLPALFYLLVIRRYALSPLFALPVMWAGGALASFFAQGSDTAVLAVLGFGALVVEVAIAAREIARFARAFRAARRKTDDALAWFFAPFMQMTNNAKASRLAANEFAMLCFALFSWKRRAPASQDGAFTYHRDSGYAAFIAGMMLVIPVETLVVHLLVSQWSDVAAWVLTAGSLYATLWLVADCRASVLRPIAFKGSVLEIRSGMRFSADIPLERVAAYEEKAPKADKKRIVNLGMMGTASGWLVFDEPVTVETSFGGAREIEAIGIAVDDKARFARMMSESIKQHHPIPSPDR
ncbi:hypothetical protein [Raoultibacter timonensis]|uniref:PH (Pleckstrin Homology) domain-containing protein n=1 Tax=Raoultibacter timonensis TaxID=1907662 RepID=A0ABN6MBZ5_9ACTN|nr:hypothetical protein [Raoultibacter timonensis]BDE95509.1 hypothetical protein CE91St30_08420 [Raoultibacter timonensis]BDF50113.1 hypothetical protein CE91St31_08430 [Raoultibacter timonensis]